MYLIAECVYVCTDVPGMYLIKQVTYLGLNYILYTIHEFTRLGMAGCINYKIFAGCMIACMFNSQFYKVQVKWIIHYVEESLSACFVNLICENMWLYKCTVHKCVRVYDEMHVAHIKSVFCCFECRRVFS